MLLSEAVRVFWAFAKVGVLGYGGGLTFVPLIRMITVQNGWMTTEEFADIFAMGNALPGPIATKLAGYVGYRAAGIPGVIAGLFGIVMPSLVVMIGLLGLMMKYRHLPAIEGMIRAIRPVVIVLLIQLAVDLFPDAIRSDITVAIALISLVLIMYIKVNPVWVIIGALALGAVVVR